MARRPDDPDDLPRPEDTGAQAAEPTPSDDERWAAIVAQLGDLGTDVDLDAPATAEPPPADAAPPRPAVTYPVAPGVADPRSTASPTPLGRDWQGSDQFDEAEAAVDDLEHFVPPDPGPVLGGDPLLTLGWLGAAGLPIGLLLALVFWPDVPTRWLQVAAALWVVSCGVLMWRLPRHRDPEDDDTGAVV